MIGVKKTKYGTYGIDYTHPLTGERIRKTLPKDVATEKEAAILRSIEIADASRGLINQAYGLKDSVRAILFADMIDEYLKWSKENKTSWRTDFFKAQLLKRGFDRKLMSDLTPFMIEKYKVERAKDVAKNTVNKDLILGKQVFKKAIEWGSYNGDNPFEKVSKFKIKKRKKPGSLSPGQVQTIMDEIKHPVKRDMVEFDFNTGWRIGEIRRLKWKDVDLKNGLAWIMDPKNGEPAEIDLNDQAVKIISRQPKKSKYVFCFKNGKPFKTNLYNVIKNAAKRADVYLPPRKAWHILRRTWASMMLQGGCDIETLRELGNWKDFSMPMWYANAGGSKHKKRMLNNIPSLSNDKKMTRSAKVIQLSS